MDTKKEHWEKVYATKRPNEVSWTQAKPKSSLKLIEAAAQNKEAQIIDIGGGDSLLVDFLLDQGYANITVLDISGNALARAIKRLGSKANQVTWVESDILDFQPNKQYDIWHDRAVFHFLTKQEDILAYQKLVSNSVSSDLILATFSTKGPLRCSGLDVIQYDAASLQETFEKSFKLADSFYEDHRTPFDTKQNFVFAHLRRL